MSAKNERVHFVIQYLQKLYSCDDIRGILWHENSTTYFTMTSPFKQKIPFMFIFPSEEEIKKGIKEVLVKTTTPA